MELYQCNKRKQKTEYQENRPQNTLSSLKTENDKFITSRAVSLVKLNLKREAILIPRKMRAGNRKIDQMIIFHYIVIVSESVHCYPVGNMHGRKVITKGFA